MDDSGLELGPLAPEDERYQMFDNLSRGVMSRNHEVLEAERSQLRGSTEGMEPVTFRFDVTTANQRELNRSLSKIDLKQMAEHTMAQRTGSSTLPSNCCYVQKLVVEDALNSLPRDVHLTCRQSGRVLGNYVKGQIPGEDSGRRTEPSLFVVHSGAQMHLSDGGREVYQSGEFTEGDQFKNYLPALKKDVEDSVTVINGGNAVEYISPHAVLSEDDVLKGDWFVDVMHNNPTSFKHPVQAIRTPAGEENTWVCSLRMHPEDWSELNKAVQHNVIKPLREHIIDLDVDPQLHLELVPDGAGDEPTASLTASHSASSLTKRSGTQAWQSQDLKGHAGRVAIGLRATLVFV
jgi:hypothetical protein